MANPTDLQGMLTSQLLQPQAQAAIPSTYEQRMLQQGQKFATGLRRGIGAMTGSDTRTTAEKAQAMMANLDINDPNDQPKILQLVNSINPAQTPKLVAAFAQQKRQRDASEAKLDSSYERRQGIAEQVRKLGYAKVAEAIIAEQGSGSTIALEGGIKILTNLAQPEQPPKKVILSPKEEFDLFTKKSLYEADVKRIADTGKKAVDRYSQYAPIVTQMKELSNEVDFGTGSVPLATINQTLYSIGSKAGLDVGTLDPTVDATLTYNSLSKRLKALLLEAQKGAISNLENTEITKNTANPSQTSNQAQALVNFLEASLESDLNRSEAQRAWLEETQSLTGFDSAWRKYTEDFPRTSGFTIDVDPLDKTETVVSNFETVKENFNLFSQLYLPNKGKGPVFLTKKGKGMTVEQIKQEIVKDRLEEMKKTSNNPNWKPTKEQKALVNLEARKNIGKLITIRLNNGDYTVAK
jgi:hypothetical protein